ncbi:MAG: ABC transporter permease [Eubacterium sp.]|nr:ABC transporter permease [Eubacterium sp.]
MIRESFRMSVKAISGNKLRSFLTMLGIIIGVMALVVLVSIANSTTRSVGDSINSLGTSTITVRVSDDKGSSITMDELKDMVSASTSIAAVSPVASSSGTAYSSWSKNYSSDSESESVNITGTGSSYAEISGLKIASGRYFNISDVDNHTSVIVISADLAEDIMGSQNCVGETIKIDGISYEIIGVLEAEDDESSGSSGFGFGGGRRRTSSYRDYKAYMPFTTLSRQSDSVSSDITEFVISAVSGSELDNAESEVTSYMLERSENDSDAFSVQNQSDIASAMEDVQNSMAMMLGGIAAISLIVGGIGIMNVMLVSVTERTREIGIRKAIGASRNSILLQFLIESVLISLMGCTAGILGSWIAVTVMSVVTGLEYTLSLGVVAVAAAFSTVIGVAFGLYPARKAASRDPIECLRYTG